jgi:nucleotidyltransferase/DNA polymerase involved in DNA repair
VSLNDLRLVHNWRELLEDEADELLDEVGTRVRDRARRNARSIDPDDVDAIATDKGIDAEGHYVDVGYDKHHRGFPLWWHEVGTSQFPPRPHLRPAAAEKVI